MVNSGQTLKEALVELGFPKANSLVVDTGIFEMEAKKAGIARDLGIDIDIELNNAQIFEAYELSGADFFVAPDEIILPLDNQDTVKQKIKTIKNNLLELLDFVSGSKIIAVIQGHQEEVVDNLLEFYRENGISAFAVGGVIPLYHHDKKLLQKHLTYVRRETRDEWLHIFGLPRMSLLSYYLHQVRVDSVDTSTLTYLTAKRRYLNGLRPEPVRYANFKECDCSGCSNLTKDMSTRSSQFFANLYIHNVVTASKESLKSSSVMESSSRREMKKPQSDQPKDYIKLPERGWMTAEEALRIEEPDQSE